MLKTCFIKENIANVDPSIHVSVRTTAVGFEKGLERI